MLGMVCRCRRSFLTPPAIPNIPNIPTRAGDLANPQPKEPEVYDEIYKEADYQWWKHSDLLKMDEVTYEIRAIWRAHIQNPRIKRPATRENWPVAIWRWTFVTAKVSIRATGISKTPLSACARMLRTIPSGELSPTQGAQVVSSWCFFGSLGSKKSSIALISGQGRCFPWRWLMWTWGPRSQAQPPLLPPSICEPFGLKTFRRLGSGCQMYPYASHVVPWSMGGWKVRAGNKKPQVLSAAWPSQRHPKQDGTERDWETQLNFGSWVRGSKINGLPSGGFLKWVYIPLNHPFYIIGFSIINHPCLTPIFGNPTWGPFLCCAIVSNLSSAWMWQLEVMDGLLCKPVKWWGQLTSD